jgi:hypothetical protein
MIAKRGHRFSEKTMLKTRLKQKVVALAIYAKVATTAQKR